MPNPGLSDAERKRRKGLVERLLKKGYHPYRGSGGLGSASRNAAIADGISTSTYDSWIVFEEGEKKFGRLNYLPDWSLFEKPKPRIRVTAEMQKTPAEPEPIDESKLIVHLKRNPSSLEDLVLKFSVQPEAMLGALNDLRLRHINVHMAGKLYSIPPIQAPSHTQGPVFDYISRPDNTFLFGALGDSHLCSKYERLDVTEDLYDQFAEQEVDRVFHTGNWIDGEFRFNKFDIHTYGLDAQCRYLAKHYPQRDGIVTYAVAGDDHEGWYSQREGVDIGAHAERLMAEAGRGDWKNLGYMEAHIRLINANTGAFSVLGVIHPGGGSAYADSYSIQKIIESLEGGEKPAIALYGHYHKLIAGEYRNVWWLQTGCGKGQDTFGRKKKLRYTLGGAICKATQDPETGAIIGFRPEMFRYFDKGYYSQRNERWSHSDDVVLPDVSRKPA